MKTHNKKVFSAFLAAFIFMFCLSSCSSGVQQSGVSSSFDEVPGVSDEASMEDAVLTIIHVNDIHGYASESETEIGYPKIAGLIEKIKQENPNTIALDAGDTFAGSPNAAFDNGESIVSILQTMPFDAMTLGNHDFYIGIEQTKKLSGMLPYPVLAGNVRILDDGVQPWDGYTIITLDSGLKVGVIGVTIASDNLVDVLSPEAVVQELADEIADLVDVTVVLSHYGTDSSLDNPSSLDIARSVTGIDVIVDGHSHTELEEGLIENGVLIAQTGSYGNNLGVIDITIKDGKAEKATARLITASELAEETPKEDTRQTVDKMLEESTKYFSQVIGSTEVDLNGVREIVRTQETNLGNMCADALREKTGAEIALLLSGSIGGEIPPGDITKGGILQIARVIYDVTLVEMTGADVVQLLETGLQSYPEPYAAFFQVSGIAYTFDASKASGERVVEVLVDGMPLQIDKTYLVTCPYLAPENAVVIKEFSTTDVIIEEYIAMHSPLSPQTENRITAI